MKTTNRFLVAGLLAGLAGAALAQEGVQDSTWIPKSSTLTRSEARAELAGAKLAALPSGEASYTIVASSSSTPLTRIQVQAEAREAIRLGLLPVNEAGGRPATAAEQEQIRQAGLRAVEASTQLAAK
jgi:hypothetical protein